MSVIAVSISPHRSFRAVRGPTSAPQMSTHRVSGFPQYSSRWFPWKRPLWTTLGLFKGVFFLFFSVSKCLWVSLFRILGI